MSGARQARRIFAGALIALGGVLLFLAQGGWGGYALIGLGVLVELTGIYLEHRR